MSGALRQNDVIMIDPLTAAQVERARRACALNAADAAELARFLDALGIGPDWTAPPRPEWRQPAGPTQ